MGSPNVIVYARGQPCLSKFEGDEAHVQEHEGLVREAQQGDAEAFGKLYELFVDRVYRYVLLRVGNATEAEDLTQEVFLKAMQGLGAFQWRGRPFAAWLFRIAHNQVVDRLRRRQTGGGQVSLDDVLFLPSHDNVEAATLLALDQERLRDALERLTELQRQVVLHRFVGGLSLVETAAAMEKTENAIKALQHAALLSLRRLLLPEQRAKDWTER